MSIEFRFLEKSSKVETKTGQVYVGALETLARIFLVFFFAGTDTTANVTVHGITLFAKYPEIQQKVFNELEVFNKESGIWFKDIENLHYTRACITEIMRFACIAPLNLIHINSGCII
ncbi:cytochrome P450 2C23a-like protein [Leptotrombidium deliense]|uniref:Cytochrome P450 2C23a-like protein n=1 Tax=Leptotrombidium deliense TaxID=299467 RepID=A0A443SS30_9ACAR|nr:cytochrome P450 2C23a-like protein [Leptotrombidium deliense]